MNEFNIKRQKIEQKITQNRAQLHELLSKQREHEKKELFKKQLIIGKIFLAKMKKDEGYSEEVLGKLDKSITKQKERELFGLPSLCAGSSNEATINSTKKPGLIKYD